MRYTSIPIQVKGVLRSGITGYKEAGFPLVSYDKVDLVTKEKLNISTPCGCFT